MLAAAITPPPLLKWAGSKRRLAEEIAAVLPAGFTTYVEPFCGSAALYLHLYARGFRGVAWLSDTAWILVSCLQTVAVHPEAVLAEYDRLRALPQDAATYNRIRAVVPLLPAARAGWFLYVNRAGFNGLWRVNRDGGFNVPWGKHLVLPDLREAVLGAAPALLHASIHVRSFEHLALSTDLRGTVIFVDPPYLRMFGDYGAAGFSRADHAALVERLNHYLDRGAFCVLSGSDCPETDAVYGPLGLARRELRITHSISRGTRPKLSELLFYGVRT
jgi:DNA adenine methylase